MKQFKVLGSGCANCTHTAEKIEAIAADQSVDVSVEKITDLETMMAYSVMSTPAVVMDEQVIHAGGVPSDDTIKQWLI
ncbi:thioredoxin family protein [Salinivibrio sp. MA351]|uniref:thioredoxin family protein n=1 Tax=Salinivibrio TaxID=51366 RepID=UPI000988DEC2|nr:MULTISPECIES: thioredoxin family protein [Salinivibrio]OOE98656.1 thioredoxin family protein [Salinivibrio sp. MA351]OOF05934.1 thioredoxin family protein [Salinivibrio sp. MA607]WBA12445.1 thioredoxin family protein [Salinivibrio kushneri]WBA18668.1 thioredoxin family protein [Salinivibrio kushneri]